MSSQRACLVLVIGNSRLHWGWFVGSDLQQAWDTPHLFPEEIAGLITNQFDFERCPEAMPDSVKWTGAQEPPYFKLASVVPEQTALWQTYPSTHVITLEQVPLQGLYATLGIDRALASWGAVQTYGAPALVIDGGTALTLTGVDEQQHLVGGAILPGLQLQLRSLTQHTAALPGVSDLSTLPHRWARNTVNAIQSGVLYTVVAGIRDFIETWQQQFAHGAIVFTGGDGEVLCRHIQQIAPNLANQVLIDPHLILRGIQQLPIS